MPGPLVDRTAFRTGLKLGNAAFSLIFSFRTGGRAGFEAIADVVGLVEGCDMVGAAREAEALVGASNLDCVDLATGAGAVVVFVLLFVDTAVTPCELELAADATLDLGSTAADLEIVADGTRGFAAPA